MKWKGGWVGKILRVDLTEKKIKEQKLDRDLALNWIGGRGFAIKILWDELLPGTDPLSPGNKLIIATGPLTGVLLPSSGKVVVAAKSPLTYGYGDGNIGSRIGVMLKMCGYDAVIVEGRAEKPVYLYITSDAVEIKDASHLWGKGAIEADIILRKEHGWDAGTLVIGPGGENLVRYAVVISEFGRAGGRPGIGAVFGSKNLKAFVAKGWKDIPIADKTELLKLMKESIEFLQKQPGYKKWVAQGTMMTVEWCQENATLPTYNYSEGVFDKALDIGGEAMEKMYKVVRKACFSCPMPCGNICKGKTKGFETVFGELDYENVIMLGSNVGVGDMSWIIKLNYLCDEYGIDTISAGNVIGFAIELYQRGIIDKTITGGLELRWGDPELVAKLLEMITYRKGFGNLLAEGVRRMAEIIGGEAPKYAMHVKGLEVSAYDCHYAPAMALAYGTSEIGAHHKSAWVISWEMRYGREKVDKAKPAKVIEFQRIRGGMFEFLTVCRLPWIELGYPLEYYPKFFKAVTGIEMTLEDFWTIADRIYALIRAFWVREYGHWKREYDYAPRKWFEVPPTKGIVAGKVLDKKVYEQLLDWYYELRGWDKNGIPTEEALKKLGLEDVAEKLKKILRK